MAEWTEFQEDMQRLKDHARSWLLQRNGDGIPLRRQAIQVQMSILGIRRISEVESAGQIATIERFLEANADL